MRVARRPALAKKRQGFEKGETDSAPRHSNAVGLSRLDAHYRHALFPASGMARKLIVAGANVTASAAAGTPSMPDSSSPAERASGLPFNRTSSSSRLAASSV